MHAYKETYLPDAAHHFGTMMSYVVNDCGIDGDLYLQMFITSGLARQFERGNPKVVAGMSGIDLAIEAIRITTGSPPREMPSESEYRTAEYWSGWTLAHYQWHTSMNYSAILRYVSFEDTVEMYPTLHEADITRFYAAADEIIARAQPQTNLRRLREAIGLSQSRLAAEAGVSLRSIQMYEQRNKDVNKAQALSLAKIARSLGCDTEELLELSSDPLSH